MQVTCEHQQLMSMPSLLPPSLEQRTAKWLLPCLNGYLPYCFRSSHADQICFISCKSYQFLLTTCEGRLSSQCLLGEHTPSTASEVSWRVKLILFRTTFMSECPSLWPDRLILNHHIVLPLCSTPYLFQSVRQQCNKTSALADLLFETERKE